MSNTQAVTNIQHEQDFNPHLYDAVHFELILLHPTIHYNEFNIVYADIRLLRVMM